MSQPWEPPPDQWDDAPRVRTAPSTAVTVLAYVTITLGGLNVVCGLCSLGFVGQLDKVVEAIEEQGKMTPESAQLFQMIQQNMGIIVGVLLVHAAMGLVFMAAGAGLRDRRAWARTLTLILGFLSGLAGGLYAFQMAPLPAIVNVGYCVWVFAVLLNNRYAAEFA